MQSVDGINFANGMFNNTGAYNAMTQPDGRPIRPAPHNSMLGIGKIYSTRTGVSMHPQFNIE